MHAIHLFKSCSQSQSTYWDQTSCCITVSCRAKPLEQRKPLVSDHNSREHRSWQCLELSWWGHTANIVLQSVHVSCGERTLSAVTRDLARKVSKATMVYGVPKRTGMELGPGRLAPMAMLKTTHQAFQGGSLRPVSAAPSELEENSSCVKDKTPHIAREKAVIKQLHVEEQTALSESWGCS